MEDKDESSASTDEKTIAPTSEATGRIDCRYKTASGATQEWSLIQFPLKTQYDAHNRSWRSEGTVVSNDRKFHLMKLSYDVSRRVLTIDLNGYLFTMDESVAMASSYTDSSTLNIKFLKDAEGFKGGDHFTIRGNSRLNISI